MSELQNSQSSGTSTAYSETTRLLGTAASRKSGYLLAFTIDALLTRIGIAHAMFVTLTFAKPIRSTKTAHDHLNSLMNAVRKRYGSYLWVLQPHASGSIHYHLLIPVDFDCHAGTDPYAWGEKFFPMEGMRFRSENPARCGKSTRETYLNNSMNPDLRAASDWWKATAKAHGFGKVRVEPIYGGAEAVCNYMIRQDWRSWGWPFKEKKNVRFWGCSQNLRSGNVKFAWNSKGARLGRQRMAEWAREHGCGSEVDLPIVLGPKWNLQFMREVVWGLPPRINADAPIVGKSCLFPLRSYSDPDFQFHPGLYEPSKSVGISHTRFSPSPMSAQAPHTVPSDGVSLNLRPTNAPAYPPADVHNFLAHQPPSNESTIKSHE